MLTLGIEYLTGYAVATSTGDRMVAEWPPHPGRVFMAMAAAFFETKPDNSDIAARKLWQEEEDALRWLEGIGAPVIIGSVDFDRRDVVEVFVPPNDFSVFDSSGKPTKIPTSFDLGLSNKKRKNSIVRVKALREILPHFRNGKERTFPKVRPHDAELFFQWAEAEPSVVQRDALDRICAKVIRIGHSSSLVRMWVSDAKSGEQSAWIPRADQSRGESLERFRMAGPGCLDYLRDQYNGDAVNRFYDYYTRIESAKGKEQKKLKAEFESVFGVKFSQNVGAPDSRRPVLSMTQAYQRAFCGQDEETTKSSVFDSTLLVLDKREGPNLGLESTWRLLSALRGAIEKHAAPTPEWVSGHQINGKPSEMPHLALLPLGFVGNEYADGHLLGVALAFPRDVSWDMRGKFLGKLLYDAKGLPRELKLTLGKLGVWMLGEEQRPLPPRALRSALWTGPSKTWASVSPVVLDRHPQSDPRKDRSAYLAEVFAIVSESCRRIGLPEPVEIDIDKTSWHRGAPRAKPGPDGYPLMPVRPGGPNRRQVHVWMRFEQTISGPILLGAGRYRGYGFCKPWRRGGGE